MTSILVTGTNRGIGLGFVKHLLNQADPPKILIATCRNPSAATDLQELKKKNSNLHILPLDVTNYNSFPDFAKNVEAIVGPNGLNVLINNAGAILAKTIYDNVTPDDFLYLFKTNTLGPIFLTKALLPLIDRAAKANKDKPEGIKRAAIVMISTTLASVTFNTDQVPFGFFPCYRESKSALNQFTRSLAIMLKGKGITSTVFCPGYVKTDLGGPDAMITVDESVSSLLKLIYSIDKSKHNKFLNHEGKEIPW